MQDASRALDRLAVRQWPPRAGAPTSRSANSGSPRCQLRGDPRPLDVTCRAALRRHYAPPLHGACDDAISCGPPPAPGLNRDRRCVSSQMRIRMPRLDAVPVSLGPWLYEPRIDGWPLRPTACRLLVPVVALKAAMRVVMTTGPSGRAAGTAGPGPRRPSRPPCRRRGCRRPRVRDRPRECDPRGLDQTR